MTSVGVRANTRFLLSEGSEARALRLRVTIFAAQPNRSMNAIRIAYHNPRL